MFNKTIAQISLFYNKNTVKKGLGQTLLSSDNKLGSH